MCLHYISHYFQGLTIIDLEDLLEDIRVYLELEEGKNADYWRDIITVTEDELQKLRKMDAANRGTVKSVLKCNDYQNKQVSRQKYRYLCVAFNPTLCVFKQSPRGPEINGCIRQVAI